MTLDEQAHGDFSPHAAGAVTRAGGAGCRVHFAGHATAIIKLDGTTLITDPVLRSRIAHLRGRRVLMEQHSDGPVDAVLISHIHQDHLDRPSLEELGHDRRLIVPAGAGRLLRRWGFRRVEEVAVGETVAIGAIRVQATPAKHQGFRPPFGPRAECLGYIVKGSRRIYFAGDTDLFAGMAALGAIDLALLPIWGWGPTLGPGHLSPLRAAEALTLIRPAVAVPIHWGTLYPLGLPARLRRFVTRPAGEFAAHAARLAPAVDVRILAPGSATLLAGPMAPR